MEKTRFIFGMLTLIGLLIGSTSVIAYTIDGDISDWGVDLNSGLGGSEGAWVPDKETVDWIVEDNIDPDCVNGPDYWSDWRGIDCKDWSGYTATGVHISGTGFSYSVYDEPVFPEDGGIYEQPAGGEHYDIEAMYFDDDDYYAYFSIVTSLGPDGYTDGWGRHTDTGDLALDLDNNGNYEYGIILTGSGQREICYNPTWSNADSFLSSSPAKVTSCNNHVGDADIAYGNAGILDNGVNNYVIEVKASKTALGEPVHGQISDLHATITCGNDVIELIHYEWDFPAPELIVAVLAIAMISPAFAYLIIKKGGK